MEDRKPLLTLRVSKDGGETWGRTRTYRPSDLSLPLPNNPEPPCECPRHRKTNNRKW